MSLAAGDLTRQIVIEALDGTKDAANRPVRNFVPYATVWAQPKGQTGLGAVRQAPEGGVSRTISYYSFRVRYRPDFTNVMRVNMGGQYFDIVQARHDHALKDWTDLVCEAGGNNG